MNKVPYIGIIILLVIILLQNRSCERKDNPSPVVKVDTVIVEKIIRDTIPGKSVLVKSKKDTIWIKEEVNTPDTTYEGLLLQYKELGNKYFTTNVYSTDFPIFTYGSVTVTDSIYGNHLISTVLTSNLTIPEKTVIVQKQAPPKRQLYGGTTFLGTKTNPLESVHLSLLLRDKKDRLYGASLGYNGKMMYGGSIYFPLIKRNR